MDKKTDLRIIKTKNALYNALIILLKEKPFEEIKVSDICKTALINRSTFYSHFNDKYELFMALIEDLKASLSSELKNIKDNVSPKEYYIKLISVFLNHIEGKEEIYRSIMISNRDSIIMSMVYDIIADDVNAKIKNDIDDIPSDIITSFYIGAVVNVGLGWFKYNKKYTKEEIIKYLEKLLI